MRKLLLTLVALAALCSPASSQGTIVGPGQQVICTKFAPFTGVAVITQIIAAVANQSISVCGWHITNTAAAGTFSFQTGTGSNCGTNTTTVVPALNVSNTAPSTDHVEYAIITLGPGLAICVTPSAATITGILYYSQF